MRLSGLQASSVRGIPQSWPSVPIGANGLVIYGPNGVGKSSIVDALEFALCRRSTLFNDNRAGVSWELAAPHVHHGEPEIALTVNDRGREVTLRPPGVPGELSDEGEAWMRAAAVCSFVLRRHMLLRFITQPPKSRYDLLEPFLNLDRFQKIEEALKHWHDRLHGQVLAQASSVAEKEARLRAVLGPMPAPASEITAETARDRLNEVLQRLGKPPSASLDASALEALRDGIAAELGGTERSARLGALAALRTRAQRLGRPAEARPVLEGLMEALLSLEAERALRRGQVLTDLLRQGRDVIAAESLDACPLCEQAIDRRRLLDRLDERINADIRISRAREVVGQRQAALVSMLRPLSAAFLEFGEDWQAVLPSMPLASGYAETAAMLHDLVELLGRELSTEQLREFAARFGAAVATHGPAIERIDRAMAVEGEATRRQLLGQAESIIDAIETDLPALAAAQAAHRSAKTQRSVVERLHGHAVEARKAAVQQVLDDVGKTANGYYERIHPHEQLSGSRLEIRPNVPGSVTLSATFHGKIEPPLLHYSESHLDTLGLCYFLALRRHETLRCPFFKVLLLDDVLHSVDAAHRSRIATLIKEEFADHQLIVTTHDEYFYASLRRALGSGKYRYMTIHEWDIVDGPRLSDPSTDLDTVVDPDLQRQKSVNDLTAAGGRFFEWLLRELTERLEVSLPARFTRKHDIGSMWPPLAARLRRQAGFAATASNLPDRLNAAVWVRNACGAHHNAAAAGVTASEAKDFLALLAELYRATWCERCDSSLAAQPDDGWRCDCAGLSYPRRV